MSGGIAGLAIGAGVKALAGKAVANARSDAAAAGSWWSGLQPNTRKWIVRIVIIVAGFFIHQHYAHKALNSAVAAAKAEQRTADAAEFQKTLARESAQAKTDRQALESVQAENANLERKAHETVVANDAADAAALRLHGPGLAAAGNCRPVDHPGPSAAAGGHIEAAPVADDAGPQVPPANGQGLSDGDAIVPWSWLVARAQEHDDLLDTERTRRDDDVKQRAAWEKFRAGGVAPKS
jgi:hypothetical protein